MMGWNMMGWGGGMGVGSFWFFIAALDLIVWLIVGLLAIGWLWKKLQR